MLKVKGDTIIEVSIAITIFSMVAALSISMMNSGVATAQGALESSMARNEIDAQAEAIRFIHDSYASERSLLSTKQDFKALWHKLIEDSDGNSSSTLPDLQANTCADVYSVAQAKNIYQNHAFIVNTRNIDFSNIDGTILRADSSNNIFTDAVLYPRIIFSQDPVDPDNTTNDSADQLSESAAYRTAARAEGVWVIAVKDQDNTVPEFYDFHIYTCWYAPNRSTPSTIGTILRLYNPELIGS